MVYRERKFCRNNREHNIVIHILNILIYKFHGRRLSSKCAWMDNNYRYTIIDTIKCKYDVLELIKNIFSIRYERKWFVWNVRSSVEATAVVEFIYYFFYIILRRIDSRLLNYLISACMRYELKQCKLKGAVHDTTYETKRRDNSVSLQHT